MERGEMTRLHVVRAALVLACLVRLDFVADFICEPVLVRFKAGIGLVIYSRAGPENTWHSLRKRDIRSQRSCNRSKPSRNVAGNAGGRRCDDHLLTMERFLPKVPAPLLAVAVSRRHLIALLVDLYAAHLMSPFPIDIR